MFLVSLLFDEQPHPIAGLSSSLFIGRIVIPRVLLHLFSRHRYSGNRALLARGSHLQKALAVQVAHRRERAQEEQHKAERSVVGRVRQVLLSENRSRQGEYIYIVYGII